MHALLRLLTCSLVVLVSVAAVAPARAAVQRPLDPLEDVEILGAAFTLLGAGAAQPGAIFQSIDLREPSKAAVLAFQPGAPIPRSAIVFFRQNKKSYKTIVNLADGTFTPPLLIVNADLVLWLRVGHHHVTATEDFPVLSSEPLSFRLKPANFFDHNPALDLRREPFEVAP